MVCSQCGECCKYLVFTANLGRPLTPDEKQYYKNKNTRIETINRTTHRFIVYTPCKHLTSNNKCEIWNTKPDVCDYKKSKLKLWKPKCCTD